MCRWAILGALLVTACGNNEPENELEVECPGGTPSITIVSPPEDQVVTANKVDIYFEVENWRLAAWQECQECDRCGEVTVYGPTPECDTPRPRATTSPVGVALHSESSECPMAGTPGPVPIRLELEVGVTVVASDTVTIDYQPE